MTVADAAAAVDVFRLVTAPDVDPVGKLVAEEPLFDPPLAGVGLVEASLAGLPG